MPYVEELGISLSYRVYNIGIQGKVAPCRWSTTSRRTSFAGIGSMTLKKDFQSHNHDGSNPAAWAAGQPVEWGHEHSNITLPSEPGETSLNADASLLAIALEHNIHIYSISDRNLYRFVF